MAAARRLTSESLTTVHLHCLSAAETRAAVRNARDLGISVSGASSGDLALETTDLEFDGEIVCRTSLERVEACAADPPSGGYAAVDSYVGLVISRVRPSLVLDATNMATDSGKSVDELVRVLHLDSLPAIISRSVRFKLVLNGLLRFTTRLGFAGERACIEKLLKVSTTGLGGMGLNLPFTHGDDPCELLSDAIWWKLALSGAQLQTLFALSRTVPFPVHLVVPAACVGFDEDVTWLGEPASAGPDDVQLPLAIGEAPFREVALGCGENRHYSRQELALLTHPSMMGAVTKEEVADAVARALSGDPEPDLIAAIGRSVIGPSERGRTAAARSDRLLADAELAAGGPTVATGNLGTDVSTLLFEAAALREAFGQNWPVQAGSKTPEELSDAAARAIRKSTILTRQLQRLGISARAGGTLGDWQSGGTATADLRPSRMRWWQERAAEGQEDAHGPGEDFDRSTLLRALRFRRPPNVDTPLSWAEARLRSIIEEFSGSRLVVDSVWLGIFERLPVAHAREISSLASELEVDELSLYRLCRALNAHGLVVLDGSLLRTSPLGAVLRQDHSRTLAPMARFAREHGWPSWTQLAEAVRTGTPPLAGFSDQPFTAFASDAKAAQRFAEQMAQSAARTAAALAAALDLRGSLHVLDLGGGCGVLADALLTRDSGLHVSILELPHVEPEARAFLGARKPTHRWSFLAGSFFDSVPGGYDVYILSRVLHDWSDAEAGRLLSGIGRAAQRRAKLVIFDKFADPPAAGGSLTADFTMSDLNVWLMCGGRERTTEEVLAMVRAAGFEPARFFSVSEELRVLVAEHR